MTRKTKGVAKQVEKHHESQMIYLGEKRTGKLWKYAYYSTRLAVNKRSFKKAMGMV